MRGQTATPETKCAEIAARQHGVITYLRLLEAGLSKGAIDRRVRAGRLHRIHRGVYAWGHRGLSNEGRWMGAVLACGRGAVLSPRRFLRFCQRNRLPLPAVNVAVVPYVVDFLWQEARLVVGTDGWKAHRSRQAFDDDRRRDAYLKVRGYEVVRLTWRQLEDDSASVLSLLRRYLRPGANP